MTARCNNENDYRMEKLASRIAKIVLARLAHHKREAGLAEIAGYVHDVGNAVGRANHESTGAVIVTMVLRELGMDLDEVAIVAGAVGNHEEKTGSPVNNVSAALILARSEEHTSELQSRE